MVETAKEIRKPKQVYEANKLAKRLCRQVGQAIGDYNMIEDGDKVMVCLSGGKDSYALLDILLTLRERAPVAFDIVAVNLDQKQPGFPAHVLPELPASARRAVPHRGAGHLLRRQAHDPRRQDDVLAVLAAAPRHPVPRRRRARRTKIALGHHRDDMLETFFLNMFFGGKLKGCRRSCVSRRRPAHGDPPAGLRAEKPTSRAGPSTAQFPIIPCNLCGSQENLQRKQVKAMLREWEKTHPGRVETMFRSSRKTSAARTFSTRGCSILPDFRSRSE